ncbi:MAG: heavy metal translocating P-type ATPase [Phycisphaeraceae bacterium]|nr:heavy metal translocating P-type ATPase [Phycisphaerae bacterium]MBX3393216.1 heavy metal translocating P-type ATPase [Phycisphaeraceae bacterium]
MPNDATITMSERAGLRRARGLGSVSAIEAGVRCSHCRGTVPEGLTEEGSEEQFCCHGCRSAYRIIRSCGLDRYYRLRDMEAGGGVFAAPAPAGSGKYRAFDDPAFHALHCREVPGGLMTTDLVLEGIDCSACVWLLERLPSMSRGVVESRLDFRRSTLRVTWDPAAAALSSIAALLGSLGHRPHPARDTQARRVRTLEDRRAMVRLAVAGACAGNAMLFGVALYAGLFDWMDAGHVELMRWSSMAVTLVSLAWPGRVFFTSAWASLRAGTANLDVPIALALAAGGAWSVASTIRGDGEVYFDTLSVLVFLLLVGRFLQRRRQRWASDAVELLFSLTPTSARRVETDARGFQSVHDVAVEALRAGDVIEVRAGDSIPADGVVVSGESRVDRSLLTGESRPLAVAPGAAAAAGDVNIVSALRVRVTAAGEATRVGQLMRMVEECSRRKAPIVRFADRASVFFTYGMITAAGATLAAWLWMEPAHAVENAVALLVVTCPCALGLATPMALTVAIGRAAKLGLLIKGGDVIERLSVPGRVLLDKTGTLTHGRPAVVRWDGDDSIKQAVAALEAGSNHPIAMAMARDLGGEEMVLVRGEQTTGGGIRGRVGQLDVAVGSPAFIRSIGATDPIGYQGRAEAMALNGLTPVLVAVGGVVSAAAGLGDSARADSSRSIRDLERLGWEPWILSGDDPRVALGIGERVGVAPGRVLGGMSPEGKLETVRRFSATGPTVMVGDGVNDAAALAAAGVGVAVHGGAEASLAAADVYINSPGIAGVGHLIEGSRRTMRLIRTILVVSAAYNLTAGSIAAAGLMSPLIAALVMPASSLTVLTICFRSRTFGGGR